MARITMKPPRSTVHRSLLAIAFALFIVFGPRSQSPSEAAPGARMPAPTTRPHVTEQKVASALLDTLWDALEAARERDQGANLAAEPPATLVATTPFR